MPAGAGGSPSCSAPRSPEACGSPARHGGIARIPPPAGRGHRPRQPAPPQHRQSQGGDRPRLRHLGAGLDHLLCRDHLRPRLPDLGRQADRKRFAVAVDRRRGGRDPGHSADRRLVRPYRPQAGAGGAQPRQCRPSGHHVRADGQRLARRRRCSAPWSSPRSPAESARSARSRPPSNSPAKAGSPASRSARPWRPRSSAA